MKRLRGFTKLTWERETGINALVLAGIPNTKKESTNYCRRRG